MDEKEKIGIEIKFITEMLILFSCDISKTLGKSHKASKKALKLAEKVQALKSEVDGAVSPADFSYCYGCITDEQMQIMFDFVEKACDSILKL